MHQLTGAIAGFGFSSGHRVVVGLWHESPIGPFRDLMWAEPDNHRTLIASSELAAEFITAIYSFDATVVERSLEVDRQPRRLHVTWLDGEIDLRLGRGLVVPERPVWFTQKIENPIARAVMNVTTAGISPTGVKETYRASGIQRIVGGWGVVAGRDLGEIGPPTPDAGFGFTEPPRFPSVTTIRPLLEDPTGRLAEIVSRSSGPIDGSATDG